MRRSLVALFLLGLAGCDTLPPSAPEADLAPSPPVPPFPTVEGAYVFRFRGLTPEQIAPARTHPDYKVEDLPGGVTQVVYTPFPGREIHEERFGEPSLAEFLEKMAFIPGPLGKTRGDYGHFNVIGWGGAAFPGVKHWLTGNFVFTNFASGYSDSLLIHAVLGVPSEQVEHDMLRNFAGTSITVEKCGDGYVIVSRAGRGVMVAWQISPQAYVHIDNCYDKGMVAAYVHRLGSLIPKDYRVDPDQWVKDEIRWRMQQIDADIRWGGWDPMSVGADWSDVTRYFANVFLIKGRMEQDKTTTVERMHDWLKWVREWLWANRENFKYDDRSRGFLLKGPDRYDPTHPPELPKELQGLPSPDYTPPTPPRNEP